MSPATKEDPKKRKTSSSSSSSSPSKPSALDRGALHAKVSKLEEESREGDRDQDARLFARTVEHINRGLEQVYQIKTKKGGIKASSAQDIAELRIKVNASRGRGGSSLSAPTLRLSFLCSALSRC